MGRKLCGKQRNCFLQVISPFPSIFKRFVLQTCKSKGLFGKGLNPSLAASSSITRISLIFLRCFQKFSSISCKSSRVFSEGFNQSLWKFKISLVLNLHSLYSIEIQTNCDISFVTLLCPVYLFMHCKSFFFIYTYKHASCQTTSCFPT